MKSQTFFWSWNESAPTADKLMTRQRAYVLLRAWRRLLRQPSNDKPIVVFRRIAKGTFEVEHAYGERATLTIAGS